MGNSSSLTISRLFNHCSLQPGLTLILTLCPRRAVMRAWEVLWWARGSVQTVLICRIYSRCNSKALTLTQMKEKRSYLRLAIKTRLTLLGMERNWSPQPKPRPRKQRLTNRCRTTTTNAMMKCLPNSMNATLAMTTPSGTYLALNSLPKLSTPIPISATRLTAPLKTLSCTFQCKTVAAGSYLVMQVTDNRTQLEAKIT